MTRIKFSDGAQFDTDGEYRVERRRGGCFVVGHGFLCPVTGKADGKRLIADLNAARRKRVASGRTGSVTDTTNLTRAGGSHVQSVPMTSVCQTRKGSR